MGEKYAAMKKAWVEWVEKARAEAKSEFRRSSVRKIIPKLIIPAGYGALPACFLALDSRLSTLDSSPGVRRDGSRLRGAAKGYVLGSGVYNIAVPPSPRRRGAARPCYMKINTRSENRKFSGYFPITI